MSPELTDDDRADLLADFSGDEPADDGTFNQGLEHGAGRAAAPHQTHVPIDPLILQQLANNADTLKVIRLDAVCRQYKIGASTLRKYARQGRLRPVRLGKYKYVTMAQLKNFLDGGLAHPLC